MVALFDYDPLTMSPNPATCHEELAFIAGDQIKVSNLVPVYLCPQFRLLDYIFQQKFLLLFRQLLSDKDPDGFYWGECRGKRGYVPQNMITDLDTAPKVSDHFDAPVPTA